MEFKFEASKNDATRKESNAQSLRSADRVLNRDILIANVALGVVLLAAVLGIDLAKDYLAINQTITTTVAVSGVIALSAIHAARATDYLGIKAEKTLAERRNMTLGALKASSQDKVETYYELQPEHRDFLSEPFDKTSGNVYMYSLHLLTVLAPLGIFGLMFWNNTVVGLGLSTLLVVFAVLAGILKNRAIYSAKLKNLCREYLFKLFDNQVSAQDGYANDALISDRERKSAEAKLDKAVNNYRLYTVITILASLALGYMGGRQVAHAVFEGSTIATVIMTVIAAVVIKLGIESNVEKLTMASILNRDMRRTITRGFPANAANRYYGPILDHRHSGQNMVGAIFFWLIDIGMNVAARGYMDGEVTLIPVLLATIPGATGILLGLIGGKMTATIERIDEFKATTLKDLPPEAQAAHQITPPSSNGGGKGAIHMQESQA